MKKTYLFFLAFLFTLAAQAQVKAYTYDSKSFDEETIKKVVAEARKNGTQEWEIKILESNLNKRLAHYKAQQANPQAQRQAVPNQVQQACTNVDFEQNNYNGWTLTSGNINGVTLPCNTCANNPGGIAAVTSSTNSGTTWTAGVDNCTSQPAVAPGGGLHSLCLNDNTAGGKMQEIKQSFQVSSSNNIFTFQYMAVMENPSGHSVNQQPYFLCQLTDSVGQVIPCTYYYAYGSSNNPGWLSAGGCSGAYYKPWTTITIDLTNYINHTLTMDFLISDCALGGHFGYAYIDGACGQLSYQNNAGICSGANANLCGPPGYATYSWQGPLTGTSQCLNTNIPGTYTLTTTNSLGCPSPILHYTVTQAPAPTANFSVTPQACSLSSTFTDMSTVSGGTITGWSWNFGDGFTATSSTAGNVQTHTYSTNGTYTVVMTCTTSAGCTSTYSVPVTVNAGLVTAITTTAVSCNGGSNGSGSVAPTGGSGTYSYTWTPNVSTTSSATNVPANNYTVNISDGAGCNTTTVVAITQPSPLSATSSFTPTICGNSNGVANATVTGGTGPYTYTWSPNGGNGSNASGLNAGSYTCNVTDSKGCLTSTAVTVTNTPGPSVSVVSTTSISCNGGNNGAVTVNGTGGTGALSYSWTPYGGSSSTASSLSAGTFTVTVKDQNGCPTTTVVTISQPTALAATSTVQPTACGASNGSATVTATGGVGGYSYTWTPSGGNSGIATNMGAGGYTCTITDVNGCSKQVPIFVTTSTGPNISVTASSSVTCFGGNNGSASVTSSGGSGGPYTYTWSPSGGSNSSASSLTAGQYTCITADVNGCLSSTTVNIAQPTAVAGVITSNNVNCNGGSTGSATINASGGTGAYTYNWSPVGGNSTTASNLPAGSYTCLVTDAQGCTGTASVTITQPPALTITVGNNPVTCNGGSNGTATVTVSGGTNPYAYGWAPSGGNNATAVGLSAGTYSCGVVDSKGCVTGITTTVTEPPAVVASITSTSVSCYNAHNGSATVTVTNNVGTTTYSWSPVAGSQPTKTNLQPGTYTVTVTDQNGCKATATTTITQPPSLSVTTSTTPIKCAGGNNGSATVNASGGTPPLTYSWTTSLGGVVSSTTTATGLSEGAYTITVTDANGCPKKKTLILTAPAAKDTLEATGTLCTTDPTVLLTAPSGGVSPNNIGGPYQWYQDGGSLTNATGVTYTADQSVVNDYSVSWYYHGCKYITTTILETFYADLFSLPRTNIFTPNDDNRNDMFLPFSFENQGGYTLSNLQTLAQKYELWVYDRWGKQMFHSTDVTQMWNGKTDGGKDAPDGTYFWIVKFKTLCNGVKDDQETKGYVQLIR